MPELSRARLRELERIHILRTIIRIDTDGNGCGVPAMQIVEAANEECDHDAFDSLPPISRRGIGQKLGAMSLDGLVAYDYDEDHRLNFWSVTEVGRELAERDPYETAPDVSSESEIAAAGVVVWTGVEAPGLVNWSIRIDGVEHGGGLAETRAAALIDAGRYLVDLDQIAAEASGRAGEGNG